MFVNFLVRVFFNLLIREQALAPSTCW